jgi:hypothetical protein
VQGSSPDRPASTAKPHESARRDRVRWLAEIVQSGRLGPLTLAVAHHADPGPAGWREYTGDPEVFYGPRVGPCSTTGCTGSIS